MAPGGEGRGQGDASVSQETPRLSANHQKLGDQHRIESASEPSEETNLANTFIPDS